MKRAIEIAKYKMANKNKTVNTFDRFLIFLFAASIILESNTIYSQINGCHYYIRIALIITSIISALAIYIRNKSTTGLKTKKRLLLYFAYIFVASSLMLANTSSDTGRIIILTIFIATLPVYLLLFFNIRRAAFNQILKTFINLVTTLCAISLLVWLASSVLGILKPNMVMSTYWGNVNMFKGYSYIHFDTQDIWWITGEPIMRNTGIFAEGPMYAAIITIALVFNNLILNEKTKKHAIKTLILLTTMISTISVTGIICSFIIIFIANRKRVFEIFGTKCRYFIAAILIALTILAIPTAIKLLEGKGTTGSARHRNADINNGLQVFVESPVMGNGINHERANESNPETGYGYSNALIPVMTDGGIILSIIYIAPAMRIFYTGVKRKERSNIYIAIIYGVLLMATAIPYRLSLIMMIAIIQSETTGKNYAEEK